MQRKSTKHHHHMLCRVAVIHLEWKPNQHSFTLIPFALDCNADLM